MSAREEVLARIRAALAGQPGPAQDTPADRADREGRITRRRIGPMRHMGNGDYFDRHHRTEDGTSYRNLTVDALVEVLSPHR